MPFINITPINLGLGQILAFFTKQTSLRGGQQVCARLPFPTPASLPIFKTQTFSTFTRVFRLFLVPCSVSITPAQQAWITASLTRSGGSFRQQPILHSLAPNPPSAHFLRTALWFYLYKALEHTLEILTPLEDSCPSDKERQ